MKSQFSIILPVYNEEGIIENVLNDLISLEYHIKYEIIIVNDGSIDNTPKIIKQFPFKLISTDNL